MLKTKIYILKRHSLYRKMKHRAQKSESEFLCFYQSLSICHQAYSSFDDLKNLALFSNIIWNFIWNWYYDYRWFWALRILIILFQTLCILFPLEIKVLLPSHLCYIGYHSKFSWYQKHKNSLLKCNMVFIPRALIRPLLFCLPLVTR